MDILPCPSRGARASASSAHCCAPGLKSSPALTLQLNSCESCVWLRSASLSALCPILIAASGSLCQRMPSAGCGVLGLQGSSFQWFTSSALLLFRMPRRAKCTARSQGSAQGSVLWQWRGPSVTPPPLQRGGPRRCWRPRIVHILRLPVLKARKLRGEAAAPPV